MSCTVLSQKSVHGITVITPALRETLRLSEFLPGSVPPYAILSHTWGPEEVTFQEMQKGSDEELSQKAGFRKIKGTCEQAMRDKIPYAWVDTCCIDKTSSAELQEAINSMWRWYEEAMVCYAYLSDVDCEVHEDCITTRAQGVGSRGTEDVGRRLPESFSKSAWFTRGWTLQELLAPINVDFFDRTWALLGTKKTLIPDLCRITGVDLPALDGIVELSSFSIAKRMSWAAERKTTRGEDRAYSLLGLFGVSMPMLYGEGAERAFVRLQEELMKYVVDHSIFAWFPRTTRGSNLLAHSPADFAGMGDIVPWGNPEPYQMS
ncbi:hypothetical protein BAUCODRAFT_127382 [Baudoinia panamericana UAMH 10762]|uniref:Uncharacterized protein n=1 Tax=Baudoinia panamericana (strain UAMH 10762) TaxID=717646 RepID=M2MYV3_BAUPA|nr:uncharacterized protein BAUCODRAFT_127382 [Baudoinia panamericana UAMH 10762]EMC91485.1 hypothetical protein BAUCODRAFT_127382 [Baudoinia panamericana UAMH 10762]